MAPGTGKTITAARLVDLPCLIICRPDDLMTWEMELEEEGFDPKNPYHIWIIDSGKIEYPPTTTKEPFPDWVLITYDLAKNSYYHKAIKSTPFQAVIADEVDYLRHWKSDRTKKVIRCTRHIPQRLGLTGSPIGNDVMDAWAPALFIDNGKTFGDDWWKFKRRHYVKHPSQPMWFPKRGAKEQIRQRLHQLAFIVHEDDVLDLPPKRSIVKSCKPNKAQIGHITSLVEAWEYAVEDQPPEEINHVVARLAKLRQVAAGFIYDHAGVAHWFSDTKVNLCLRLVEKSLDRCGGKVVVWCAHRAELTRLHERLREAKIGAVVFSGTNRGHRERIRKDFRDNPNVHVFLGQADAGRGMNELTVANRAIYFSNSFKVVSRHQSERRIRRRGSEYHKRILYYDLVTEGTVDVPNLQALRRNTSIATYILTQLRENPTNTIRKLVGFQSIKPVIE